MLKQPIKVYKDQDQSYFLQYTLCKRINILLHKMLFNLKIYLKETYLVKIILVNLIEATNIRITFAFDKPKET